MSAPYYQDRRQGPRRLRRQLVEFDKRRYAPRPTVRCDDGDASESILVMIASGFCLMVIIVIILVVVA